jgi:hypothetical protein
MPVLGATVVAEVMVYESYESLVGMIHWLPYSAEMGQSVMLEEEGGTIKRLLTKSTITTVRRVLVTTRRWTMRDIMMAMRRMKMWHFE